MKVPVTGSWGNCRSVLPFSDRVLGGRREVTGTVCNG